MHREALKLHWCPVHSGALPSAQGTTAYALMPCALRAEMTHFLVSLLGWPTQSLVSFLSWCRSDKAVSSTPQATSYAPRIAVGRPPSFRRGPAGSAPGHMLSKVRAELCFGSIAKFRTSFKMRANLQHRKTHNDILLGPYDQRLPMPRVLRAGSTLVK